LLLFPAGEGTVVMTNKCKEYCPGCQKKQLVVDNDNEQGLKKGYGLKCKKCNLGLYVEVVCQPDWEDITWENVWENGHREHLLSESEEVYGMEYEE